MNNIKGKRKVWIDLKSQDFSAVQISWQSDVKSSSTTAVLQKLVHLQTWIWGSTCDCLVPVWGWSGISLNHQPVKYGPLQTATARMMEGTTAWDGSWGLSLLWDHLSATFPALLSPGRLICPSASPPPCPVPAQVWRQERQTCTVLCVS